MSLLSVAAKRTLTVFCCGVALGSAPLLAQTEAPAEAPGPPPAAAYGGPRHGGPGHRIEMLRHELNLSPEQTAQVKTLFDNEHAKMGDLRSNTVLAEPDRRSQAMAIHRDEETQLRALLTPDQVAKYDAMRARMHAHMEERENGDGPPPPPPPPPPGSPQ